MPPFTSLGFSLLVVGFLSLLSGCLSPVPGNVYAVHISPEFTTEQQELIKEGLDEWTASVGDKNLHFTVTLDDCSRADSDHIICIHASTKVSMMAQGASSSEVGFTKHDFTSDSSDVYLAMDTPSAKQLFKPLTLHELGHAFGLHHTEAGTVMCSNLSCGTAHVTCADVDQYEHVRNLTGSGCVSKE